MPWRTQLWVFQICSTNVKKKSGEDSIDLSKFLRVLEGDMGTCLNFESLVRQRFRAGHEDKALTNILNMPGLARAMWNVASKVLSPH